MSPVEKYLLLMQSIHPYSASATLVEMNSLTFKAEDIESLYMGTNLKQSCSLSQNCSVTKHLPSQTKKSSFSNYLNDSYFLCFYLLNYSHPLVVSSRARARISEIVRSPFHSGTWSQMFF